MTPLKTLFAGSVREMRQQISPLLYLWPIFIIAAVICGIFFAFRDFDTTNPLISFPIGIITGILYFLFSFGSIISVVFFTAYFFSVSKDRYERRITYATYSHDNVHWRFWVYGLLVTALWMAPLFSLVSATPVLGDQITFMFRDKE